MRAINACNKIEKRIILHFFDVEKKKKNKNEKIKKEKKGRERRDSNPSSYLQASPWTLNLLD